MGYNSDDNFIINLNPEIEISNRVKFHIDVFFGEHPYDRTTEEDANFLLVVDVDGVYQGVYINTDVYTALKSALKYCHRWNDLSDVAAYVPFKINKDDWFNEWSYNTRWGNIMKKYTTEDCFYAAGKGELTFDN